MPILSHRTATTRYQVQPRRPPETDGAKVLLTSDQGAYTSQALSRWRHLARIRKSGLLLICRPRRDERLSWPSWLTCSGLFTHSGHSSAAGRAHDRVSSPAKDQRSANCATQPTRSDTRTPKQVGQQPEEMQQILSRDSSAFLLLQKPQSLRRFGRDGVDVVFPLQPCSPNQLFTGHPSFIIHQLLTGHPSFIIH